ncbi:MAG: hypothetical protein RI897_2705 [Verrucomicrobiota bacterium]
MGVSDSIIASLVDESIAEVGGGGVFEAGDGDGGLLGSGGIEREGGEVEAAFEGAAFEVDVLESGEGQELYDLEPDAFADFED